MNAVSAQRALSEFREAYTTLLLKAEALKSFLDPESASPVLMTSRDILVIVDTIAASYQLTRADILGKRRFGSLVEPRWMAMLLSRELLQASLQFIADEFGGRDHGTIIYALNELPQRMKIDPVLAQRYAAVKAMAQVALGIHTRAA